MSRFNAKHFFLFTVLTVTISLSLLFAQLFSERLPLTIITLGGYALLSVIAVSLSWILTKKIFSSFFSDANKNIISSESLFSFTHDPTTHLPNAQQATSVFNSALKHDKGRRFAAVVFKPINFQQVNSLLGYHNSDLLLLQLAYCLQKKISANELLLNFGDNPDPVRIARLQSLQFLVIYDLTDNRFDDQSMLDDLCRQLGDTVPEAMSFKSFSLNFELAFGVAISGQHGDSVDQIIAHAGDALLNGLETQSFVSYFDNSTILHTQNQLARMESLRSDIRDQNLHCYLKPQVNVNNHDIQGFLLRVHWYEKDASKPLELEDFSSLAEHSGELHHLAKYMFEQAFITLSRLHGIGVYQRVSVVLTSATLFEVDLVDFIETKLEKNNLSGKYLMIELSEDIMLNTNHQIKSIIDQLKSLDILISISDFSGGFESLRYVRKMAIHQLKINCQNLSNDSENRVEKAITNSLVSLTRSMKIPLVGTNINRFESSEAYRSMGGELIEGDIIHPGVVPDEIEIWLERWYLQHPESIPPEAKPSIY